MARILKKPMAKAATRRNPHMGSSFDDFLKEEGIFEEVQTKALKRAIAEQLEESMEAAHDEPSQAATTKDYLVVRRKGSA